MPSLRGLKSRLGAARARRVKQRERERRAEFVQSAAEEASHLAVERDGAVYILPVRQKAGVDRFLKLEWKEERHLKRALQIIERLGMPPPGGVFLDVGAHVGTTTIAAVRRFGFESAIALEPEPENFRLLRANIGINGLESSVATLNVAVSNRLGTAELKLRPAFGAKHRLVEEAEPGAETISVELTTLDALTANGTLNPGDAGLLWLDVEGHELEALEGARTLRRRGVPIVMEFIPRALDGKLAPLTELLGEHYTHVADLRHRVGGEVQLFPLDLEALAKRYGRGFTDLLVLSQ